LNRPNHTKIKKRSPEISKGKKYEVKNGCNELEEIDLTVTGGEGETRKSRQTLLWTDAGELEARWADSGEAGRATEQLQEKK